MNYSNPASTNQKRILKEFVEEKKITQSAYEEACKNSKLASKTIDYIVLRRKQLENKLRMEKRGQANVNA